MSEPTRWITVGELAHAFGPDSNVARPTAGLAGRTLELDLEDGQRFRYRFDTGSRLVWSTTSKAGHATEIEEDYFASEVRPGIHFVDYVRHQERATSVSLVLDLDLGIVTALNGTLPDAVEAQVPLAERAALGKELTAVATTFASGAIDGAFTPATRRHLPTADLVGRRMEYTYSPTECYEHVYLNENFYSWHCLSGAEQGLADTERCHYYKLADDLYLFVWREKIVPTLGVVVVDFAAMRTAGKIFGYQGSEFAHTANFVVGARARLVNVTTRA